MASATGVKVIERAHGDAKRRKFGRLFRDAHYTSLHAVRAVQSCIGGYTLFRFVRHLRTRCAEEGEPRADH